MKILLYICIMTSGIALISNGSDVSDYYSIFCGISIVCWCLINIITSYRQFMNNNITYLNTNGCQKYGCYNEMPRSNQTPTIDIESKLITPTTLGQINTIKEISKKIPLTTSIVSYTTSESQLAKQPTVSPSYTNETFLNKINKQFNNSDDVDSEPLLIDNDILNKPIIPQSELTQTYTYTSTNKNEDNTIKMPINERFTPYKAKIYNDIIYVLSHFYKSFSQTNKVLNAIPYIECSPTKTIIYVRQSILSSSFGFPYKEITDALQDRLGKNMEINFASISSKSIAEYFVQNLNNETECLPIQTNTTTNVGKVGINSSTLL